MANKPELLAPAGSPEALRAALRAGADAVYVGGKQYSARMNARNFDDDALKAATDECHAHGARLYIALNTQIYDRAMTDALNYAARVWELGADALIIADLGLISLLHAQLPALPLHASTQLGVHNLAAARFCAQLGMTRAVCAREARADDLRALCAQSPIEIEAFVHGALCASQSGGCLFSSMVGGRSGNRGECAQPCRLPYSGSYPLSLKDLCLARHMNTLTETGVASLKIEGRMRGADYVGGVTSVYRTLLDTGRDADGAQIAYLSALFSRSGFTDGYFTDKIDGGMLGVRTDADKAAKPRKAHLPAPTPRAPIVTEPRTLPHPLSLPRLDPPPKGAKRRTARFYDPSAILNTDFFDIIYLPLEHFDRRVNGVLLPSVILPHEYDRVRESLARAIAQGAQHLMVTNPGQFELARESGLQVHLDYRFNVYNSYAADLLSHYGSVMLSPELTLPQMRDIRAGSAVVYGRIPLMTLERPTGKHVLVDRRGVHFPVLREAGRDIVCNSVPLYMADRPSDLARAGITDEHFIFTTEDTAQVRTVIRQYQTHAPANGAFTRIKAK